jgi:L-ascorbate metabolism protein UlaG (beta-lactamase superfamily)
MKITFYGQACFLFETQDAKIIVDPWLIGNPLYTKELKDIPSLDAILVTHAHTDHIGNTAELAKRDGALVIVNAELGQILRSKYPELKIHTMHIGGGHQFPFGYVKMTPALHGSGYSEAGHVYNGGLACGYLLTLEGQKIFHAGDTGLSVEMSLLATEEIDLALLPIGGNYTMDTKDAVRANDMIKPKKVIPMHYTTFDAIKADPKTLKNNALGIEVVIVHPMETIEL